MLPTCYSPDRHPSKAGIFVMKNKVDRIHRLTRSGQSNDTSPTVQLSDPRFSEQSRSWNAQAVSKLEFLTTLFFFLLVFRRVKHFSVFVFMQ